MLNLGSAESRDGLVYIKVRKHVRSGSVEEEWRWDERSDDGCM